MSESTTDTTGLTHQYSAQVAADLETNLKEQERISGDVAALQQQLAALQHDHSVLVNIQQALGVTQTTKEPTPSTETAAVPSPRQKTKTAPRSKQAARKTTTAQERTTAKKSTAKSETKTAQPTLVELIRQHLTEQGEPRSAAEISTALGQAHPERDIKTKVVRVTLEGLVARSQAQRAKQGSSVFYTAPEAETTPAPDAQPEGS
ncbi:hypothetical protein M2158_005065 [Streptomyces sp. SAI-144]|uniref:hypothetical protein n=1 Tax=unclassified Streptomyces TaxID=2593676 RepID=UPI002474FBB9|nr:MULTISPECIES: hypothetical protein [unclassified Streptomyces]MDH6436525.1 hypothetical protein [Streptomyces sp. SAI-144]MDH6493143.1 hypothetical protein [Streptomyces sp. SAI-127]